MSKPTPPTYKTRNWPVYNEALKRRGSLTIWFDPAMTWDAAPTGKRGRQPHPDLPDDQGSVRHGAPPDHRFRREPAASDRPGLGRARLQHAVAAPEDPEGQHPLPRFGRPVAPAGRQHRDQGRGRRGMERPQARRFQAARLAQDPHRDRREILGNPGCRVHHQRRGRCRAGERHRFERTGEGCCPSCWTRSRPIRKSQPSPPTAPSTPASATTPSPPAARLRSFRPARTPNPGTPTPPGPSHGTRSCAHQGALVEPSGDDGAAITAEAGPRPRCTASVLNGFPALGTPITKVAGQVCPGKGELCFSPDLCNRAVPAWSSLVAPPVAAPRVDRDGDADQRDGNQQPA